MSEWVKVEDQLPQNTGMYLMCGYRRRGKNFMWIGPFNGSKFHGFKQRKAVCWMPLPTMPALENEIQER